MSPEAQIERVKTLGLLDDRALLAPGRTTRLYVSGPMTGLPHFNYPAFHAAAASLRAMGFDVVNPAEARLPGTPTWKNWMRHHIPNLLTCDGIYMLPGWRESKGARLEHHITVELDCLVVDHAGFAPECTK